MTRTRNRWSRQLLFATLAAAAAAGVAAATPIGAIANAQIAAAGSGIPTCDTHGFTVAYSLTGTSIAAVTVGSIPDANCEGATLTVTITDANGNTVATTQPGTVTRDADTANDDLTLALASRPAVADAAGVEIAVVDA